MVAILPEPGRGRGPASEDAAVGVEGRLPAEVRLIHGDPEARHALAARLAAETGGRVRVMNGGEA